MATTHNPHIWYRPADIAAMVVAVKHGESWRAPCPAHYNARNTTLSIREGKDRHGNPVTLLHCFAYDCALEDICAALGITVGNLFCMHPDYYKTMRHFPRAKSPRIARIHAIEEPTPDEIAQILLEEMIVSDPPFIQECQPARAKMWELAQTSPKNKEALTKALRHAGLRATQFWHDLATEMEC